MWDVTLILAGCLAVWLSGWLAEVRLGCLWIRPLIVPTMQLRLVKKSGGKRQDVVSCRSVLRPCSPTNTCR